MKMFSKYTDQGKQLPSSGKNFWRFISSRCFILHNGASENYKVIGLIIQFSDPVWAQLPLRYMYIC